MPIVLLLLLLLLLLNERLYLNVNIIWL